MVSYACTHLPWICIKTQHKPASPLSTSQRLRAVYAVFAALISACFFVLASFPVKITPSISTVEMKVGA
uniref:Uncharacterized protein n=1 Tax=Populus trichocarpa TaxID=3694 RepID=A0A2K1WP29_POPTR